MALMYLLQSVVIDELIISDVSLSARMHIPLISVAISSRSAEDKQAFTEVNGSISVPYC